MDRLHTFSIGMISCVLIKYVSHQVSRKIDVNRAAGAAAGAACYDKRNIPAAPRWNIE